MAANAVQIADSARARILASRKVVDDIIARDAVVYGVNTGFGKLAESAFHTLKSAFSIESRFAATPAASVTFVRAGSARDDVARANVLTLIQRRPPEVIELLCQMLNQRVHPVVPEKRIGRRKWRSRTIAHLALN